MDTDLSLWCVIPAAGRGERFGGSTPKQYVTLAGKTLLERTIENIAAHPNIVGLMVVLAEEDVHWSHPANAGAKPIRTAVGGDSRADSVLCGLRGLRDVLVDDDFVLIHDAARPCVAQADITRLLELGIPAGGALLALPVRDTLKLADSHGRSMSTEPREFRWRAQTPQLFRYAALVDALGAVQRAGVTATDEAMAMERAGHQPLLVEGSERNIKVTTPDDLALAEYFLAVRAQAEVAADRAR